MLSLPYEHLNLRYNPFGELEPPERAALAVIEPLSVEPGEALQLIGESGRGKTTHLLALQRRMPGAVYERVDEHGDRYRAREFPAAGYLLDEAQLVRPRLLRRLFARAPRLVLGTHVDLSRWSRRPVRTVWLSGLAQAKLDAVIQARIEAARRAVGPLPRVPAAQQRALISRFGDDLRAIESHLYDVFQRLEGPRDVEV